MLCYSQQCIISTSKFFFIYFLYFEYYERNIYISHSLYSFLFLFYFNFLLVILFMLNIHMWTPTLFVNCTICKLSKTYLFKTSKIYLHLTNTINVSRKQLPCSTCLFIKKIKYHTNLHFTTKPLPFFSDYIESWNVTCWKTTLFKNFKWWHYENKIFDKQHEGLQAMRWVVYIYSLYWIYMMFNICVFVSFL